ncbi:long-chain acyl-CoA synthetase [Variovorax sp. OK605]|uniref:acyl-CoA synthetase n=1 Tax=Variovorax sp. OK605 TaxID=1855317 RepID=UPI0008E07CF9|nr:long-chain acyl-CoA synthetase [Variovorax sp. OK605]
MSQVILDQRSMGRDALMQRALRAARGLHALGVREGDAVALLLRNDFAFFEAQQAAAALGAYAVPVNWHGKPEEVLYIVNDVQPKVLVAHADLLAPVREQVPATTRVITVPTPPEAKRSFSLDDEAVALPPGATEWNAWLEAFAPWDGPPLRSRATMIYTSGTTGRAKGVKRDAATPEQAAAYVELLRSVYGLRQGVRALIGGPLYHSSPNAFARQALQVADLLVMQTRFDAEAALAAIERHRITHMVAVPTMFVRMLKLPEAVRQRHDLRSLQWVTHTGAPCSPETKRALMDWWGPVVYETYGGTEVGTATLSTPEDWLAFPGSVGRLTPGARMALYGEDGRPVAPGEVGEIFVRVPAYADFTYHNHPQKRAEVERDGLVSCGDVGYVKDEHLYLCDRRADMVISAGVNIYPAEIEAVLLQCPDVRDCAVFGIPDDEMGESLAAAVEPMPGATPDAAQLRAFLEARIARYKVPRRIDFHAALPREDSGKIFKRRLRDPFWQAAGRKI